MGEFLDFNHEFPCLQGPGHYKGMEQIVKDALNQMPKENDPSKSTRSLTTQVAPYANTSKTMKLFLLLLFSRSVMSSSL